VPALIATCDADGNPNVTYLSQVYSIDAGHVALSCQFFNKTKQNVLVNPQARIELSDPVTFEAWRLDLRYLRSEESGPLFDTMAVRIAAIASHTGMTGIFKLIAADVYEVVAVEKLDAFIDVPARLELELEPSVGYRTELRGLQAISQQTCCAEDLASLLDGVLECLEVNLGFEHIMFLLPDETGTALFTVASRGYDGAAGIGAEVPIGEGLIGSVAQQRRLVRLSGMDNELRYGRAIRTSAQHTGDRGGVRPEIPLAGLPDAQSHLALPLVVADRLVGVLAVESRARLAFDEWDEAFLEIIANQVAVGLDNMLLRERAKGDEADDPTPSESSLRLTLGPVRKFRFFKQDDCVFVDDEYLIRNVPGRILWKLLRAHVDTGRTEFSNRELRLDPWLGLPQVRDNLESRLVLLRKRLEVKCPELKLPSTSRGHFKLDASCVIQLAEAGDTPGS
jgi:hypothetical protein